MLAAGTRVQYVRRVRLIDAVYQSRDGLMELRHLRYFCAVAETLHFGKAAARLGIAQPSLSHQIRQLEAELQTTLLRRTRRRVELTEAGRTFFDAARDIVARADRAAVAARRAGDHDVKRLRVGIGYCMDHCLVADAVGVFNARHSDVPVDVTTLAASSLLTELRNGSIDVAFVRPPVADQALSSEVVLREPLMAALPPRHRLARRARLPLAALAAEPFILPPREAVPVFHEVILATCRRAGFVPDAPLYADHLQTMLALVATKAGVTLVPEGVRRTSRERVVYRPLDPSPEMLETAVAWRRDDSSRTLAEFLKSTRRALVRRRRLRRAR